jgi:diguanylate cyclase (GGDEF)-like protein/PAS domain S-box-containing protein
MHHLLKRQLKKTGADVDEAFFSLVDQAYKDADEDRNLLEHSLDISSAEMKALYDEQKRSAKERLRRSEDRYHKLVNALKDHYFFYAHDTEGVFIYLSDSIEVILGYSIEEFSTHYARYLTDDPINKLVDKYTKNAILGEQQDPYVLSIYAKDGTIHYLEVTEFPVKDENEKVIEIEGIARDITSQYLIQEKLDYISQHDELTGILNRLSLYKSLQAIIVSANRNKEKFALLFLDLDKFKAVNDSLGHEVGDILLKKVVQRVQLIIRKSDVFARIGGDEFIIILPNVTQAISSKISQKIINRLREPFEIQNHSIEISSSIGISEFPQDGQKAKTLLKHADEAMYTIKDSGRDNFTYYSA